MFYCLVLKDDKVVVFVKMSCAFSLTCDVIRSFYDVLNSLLIYNQHDLISLVRA